MFQSTRADSCGRAYAARERLAALGHRGFRVARVKASTSTFTRTDEGRWFPCMPVNPSAAGLLAKILGDCDLDRDQLLAVLGH
jgi:predicted RNA binding protein YcfA (HicA-like mRNA interferase family)